MQTSHAHWHKPPSGLQMLKSGVGNNQDIWILLAPYSAEDMGSENVKAVSIRNVNVDDAVFMKVHAGDCDRIGLHDLNPPSQVTLAAQLCKHSSC